MSGRKLLGVAVVWAGSLVGVGLWAQGAGLGAQPTGSLAGAVEDVRGGAIPGATIVLISESRGTRSLPAVSNAEGDFVFPTLTPDVYTVEATMPGFRVLRRPGITVRGGSRLRVPTLVMEVPQRPGSPRPGDRWDPIITGDDIGFQPMFSPNTPAGVVSGRWMVRVNGEWRVATSVVQATPVR